MHEAANTKDGATDSMIRLALIGGDASAEAYASALQRVPHAFITAVVESDPDNADRVATTLGASVRAASLDDLLDRYANAFDAVLIHSMDHLHAEHAAQAARAGKHVFVETPLALSTEMANETIEACDSAGVCLMVGQPLRFEPSQQAVKQALTSGKLGTPGLLRIHCWRALDAGKSPEREPKSIGSSVVNRLIGELDLANGYFDALPTHVYAVGRGSSNAEAARFDYVQIHLGFPDGGMALIDFSASLPAGRDYFALSLIGSKGAAYVDDHHNTSLLYRGGDPTAMITGQSTGYVLSQLQEFVDAIQEKRAPVATGAEGLAAMRVAEAAVESMTSGKAVHLACDR